MIIIVVSIVWPVNININCSLHGLKWDLSEFLMRKLHNFLYILYVVYLFHLDCHVRAFIVKESPKNAYHHVSIDDDLFLFTDQCFFCVNWIIRTERARLWEHLWNIKTNRTFREET